MLSKNCAMFLIYVENCGNLCVESDGSSILANANAKAFAWSAKFTP